MKHIGIIPNKIKDKDLRMTETITKWLVHEGLDVYTSADVAKEVGGGLHVLEDEAFYEKCECIIAIGGDGTILGVAEEACRFDVPIVGVNLGRLGFLADIEPIELENSLKKLLAETYTIEERMMLRATVVGPDGEKEVFHALNDINVTRGTFARIVEFEIRVNGDLSDVYPADGIIVSTPTGSTAYNLSAGGPIVLPHAKSYVITPICPHTIYSKSIMLSDTDSVQIKILEDNEKGMALSIDGKLKMYLTTEHIVHIEKSPYVTKLIKCSERKFFEILREKIVERRR